jgi:GAF domain-containing protein
MDRLNALAEKFSRVADCDQLLFEIGRAAREVIRADGATLVLRNGDCCYYAEENAISPLWKGRRFPMSACISGWVMVNRRPVVIEDIYLDTRIPVDAYRPTFVRSLAMVPVGSTLPVAAIGNYWAKRYSPSRAEMEMLEGLAAIVAGVLNNADLSASLKEAVVRRAAAAT